MTENELKAIKWMKCVKDDAIVTLDHIARNEPNVSPMLYAGRKEKAETIINGFEELEQYRAIGTVEECREAMERQMAKKPERKIQEEDLKIGCITFKAGTKTYWCPSCKKAITGSDNYCRWCGQSIDLCTLK